MVIESIQSVCVPHVDESLNDDRRISLNEAWDASAPNNYQLEYIELGLTIFETEYPDRQTIEKLGNATISWLDSYIHYHSI
jgi:hypothetical protein